MDTDTVEQYSRTRLHNIYNYSSMRWTKEKKQLKNRPVTFKHGLKHQGEYEES